MTEINTFQEALQATFDKKAREIVVLELGNICSFSDRFLICSGSSVRQNQSISDGINERLRLKGVRCNHIEGYSSGEWILMDYLDFVVHIFTDQKRAFYDLERLWPEGKSIDLANLIEKSV